MNPQDKLAWGIKTEFLNRFEGLADYGLQILWCRSAKIVQVNLVVFSGYFVPVIENELVNFFYINFFGDGLYRCFHSFLKSIFCIVPLLHHDLNLGHKVFWIPNIKIHFCVTFPPLALKYE